MEALHEWKPFSQNDACKCFGLWKKPALMIKLMPYK